VTLGRLLLLSLLLFAAGLGLRDPWPADEPRFALIAHDMVLSGNWLIPRVGGEAYSDKPPLFMWLVAGAYALIGNLRIASLLPSLLAGLGVLLLVYDLARRLWGPRSASLAGLLLVLTVQFTMQARTAQIDALISFWTTLGIYGLLRHLLLGPHWRWYFVAWFAMGLGIITKGVGFLPMLMLLPWAAVRVRWPERLPRITGPVGWWWLGPLLMLLAVALWLVPMLAHVAASGSAELAAYRDDILLRQTAQRYARAWHHIQPFWYYAVEVIPWAWAPFSLLLPSLAPAWWRRLKTGDAATWLLLGWVACVLVFFSVTPGKRHVYILPALPALALAAAPLLDELLQRRGVRRVAFAVVAAVAIAGVASILWVRAQADVWGFDLRHVVVVMATLAVALVLAALRIGAPAALVLLIIGCWQIYGWWAAPLMNGARSGLDLMARVEEATPAESVLGLAGWKEQFLLQAHRPVVHFGFRREAAAEARDAAAWLGQKPGRRLLIGEDQMPPCFDPAAGEPLGQRHRRDWRLVGPQALTGACAQYRPLHVRHYDPARGSVLAAGEGEPDAAADEAGAGEARDDPNAFPGKQQAGAADQNRVRAVGE
jgi:4-amino-4-deoxy-L-arabinose transferase-like glycosyltransferase